MALDPKLLEILACPKDKGPLIYFADEGVLYNPRSRLRYRVDDGIPVMLADEAQVTDDAEHARLMARSDSEQIGFNWTAPEASEGSAP